MVVIGSMANVIPALSNGPVLERPKLGIGGSS